MNASSLTGTARRMLRLIAFSALALFLASHGVQAETRLLSIGTDKPEVEIEAVSAGGIRLKEAGRSGDRVFIEIGKADQAFVCRQDLTFRLSDGREIKRSLDLCAANYQIDVAVGEATRIQRRIVMIEIDDGSKVREVHLDGKRQKITRSETGTTFIEVEGDPSAGGEIACRRKMKLVLEDGRIIERSEDICGDNKVYVAVDAARPATGSPERPAVRQAVPSGATPSAPPIGAEARRQPRRPGQQESGAPAVSAATDDAEDNASPDATASDTPPSGTPEFIEGGTWTVRDDPSAKRASLTYALPQDGSDGFTASCGIGSSEATITLVETVDALREGASIDVSLNARDADRDYRAKGSEPDTDGKSYPTISLPITDPIWEDLIRGEIVTVSIAGSPRYAVSLKGSAQAVRRFLAFCQPPQRIVEAPATPGFAPSEPAGGPSCADEGYIRSVPSDRPATLVFRNNYRGTVIVNWIDYNGNRRFQTDIPPGGELRQPTVLDHPWLISTTQGECLGVYLPRSSSRTVTITGSPRQAPPAAPPTWETQPDYGVERAFIDVTYGCEGGTEIDVTFDNARGLAVVREIGLRPVSLRQVRPGPSFFYRLRSYSLTGRGEFATWDRPGTYPKKCRAY
ncbi:hypothetical protein H2509_17250 [Stappia sp. F7233]|uniref:von Hippel-Lindau disease tumour suppressor beta domain-containing protein n=1 Tax=Stappia albiluteola TaxID=2758565 RepID=A0A839AIJ3_9HYPH|nr:hypothetical protein [Stappia albiluteola]MBA5778876.1 hypothetical protein [Stappia albiluteola]